MRFKIFQSLVGLSAICVLYVVFVALKFRVTQGNKGSITINLLAPKLWPNIKCIKTKTLPVFTACLLPPDQSKVSMNISKNGIWEPYLVKMLQRALTLYPYATVIDVGANVGFFTMLTASMGHPVVAVEPVASTARCIQKSVAIDRLHNLVLIVNNAISGKRTYFEMGGDDMRAGYVKPVKEVMVAPGVEKSDMIAPSVHMDDLLRFVKTDVAIIKIDIEGYECQAMKKMTNLLQSVFVPYIFMEWIWIYRNQNKADSWCTTAELRALVAQLLDAGYVPFDAKRRSTGRLDPDTIATTWDVKDMGWRHKSAPHLLF